MEYPFFMRRFESQSGLSWHSVSIFYSHPLADLPQPRWPSWNTTSLSPLPGLCTDSSHRLGCCPLRHSLASFLHLFPSVDRWDRLGSVFKLTVPARTLPRPSFASFFPITLPTIWHNMQLIYLFKWSPPTRICAFLEQGCESALIHWCAWHIVNIQ